MKEMFKKIFFLIFIINIYYSYFLISSYAISNDTKTLNIDIENNQYNSIITVRQFYNNNSINNVVIQEGITEIHDEAFGKCSNLTDITIPKTVVYISEGAFWECSNQITIHGVSGSVAEEYAEKNGYKFLADGYEISTIREEDSYNGIYSLEEELIKNNLSEYSQIYGINNIHNATKISIISAMKRIEKFKTDSMYSIGFITDAHLNDSGNNYSENSLNAFTATSKLGVMNLGIVGGDLFSSYKTDYQQGVNYERHAIDKLSYSSVPLLFVKGNHECNIKTGEANRISNNKLTQIYNSSYEVTNINDRIYNPSDEDGLYYYKDIEEKNLRICVLNSFDGDTENMKINEKQLNFIAKDMLNFKGKSNKREWSVVFFIHRYQVEYKSELVKIINAFQNGTNIILNNETIDYSTQGKGNFIALIGGDLHKDSYDYSDGFLYITTTRAFSIEGEIATADETAFDIFTIDTEKKRIYATRVGRGEDRSWGYSNDFEIEDVEYNYNNEKNCVRVTVTANRKFIENKPTWNISEDGYSYSKDFYYNQKYITKFDTEKSSNEYIQELEYEIEVNKILINVLSINFKYIQNSDNTVTAIAYSNIPLANTKPTWILSTDGYTYTKTFDTNQTYETPFQSISGLICVPTIVIEQVDKSAPDINIEASFNSNGTITMIANSNEQLEDTKPSWTISKDKKSYYKTIYDNYSTAGTDFVDLFGNSTQVKMSYNLNNKPKADYQYAKLLNCQNEIVVIVNSTIPMQNTKVSWNIAKDGMSYYKVYSQNYNTSTPFIDINNNNTNLDIEINEIKKDVIPEIQINYLKNSDGSITVKAISNEKLQDRKLTWQLSADRYTYTKTYYNSHITTSNFVDIFDNVSKLYNIEISI